MKKHIILILRTLFSNNACVEAARTREKKYNIIAVIFALFALFFAAMPTCVTGFQQQGGNWLRGLTYSYETGMKDFGDTARAKGVALNLGKNHKLTADNWTVEGIGHYKNCDKDEAKVEINDLPCFVSTMPATDPDHKILEIYYCDATNEKDFSKYVARVLDNLNPTTTSTTKDDYLDRTYNKKDDKYKKKNRSTSFIVFGTYWVQGVLYQPSNTSVAASIYGDYENTPAGNLIDVLSKEEATIHQILTANQKFFDQVFINPRRANTWKQTGIILGVDAGVILLMGTMVFLLTRGKNNPFRIYSFWDGQKIAYYACLTPGILALFGFLMQNMAMMLFILGAGVRVMWLSMRTLRYQAPAKQ